MLIVRPTLLHLEEVNVDNGGCCDLRVSFVRSVVRFFSRTTPLPALSTRSQSLSTVA